MNAEPLGKNKMPGKPADQLIRPKQFWYKDGKGAYLFDDQKFRDWRTGAQGRNYRKWPCPEGALGKDATVNIYWDLDNVSMPTPHIQGLRPHDQYSLLLSTFGAALGTDKVWLYVYVSQQALNSLGPAVKENVTAHHTMTSVQVMQGKRVVKGPGGGKMTVGKTEISDVALKDKLQNDIKSGKRGDAIVIISGDQDFLSDAKAAQIKGINFYLLHGSSAPLKGKGPLVGTSRRASVPAKRPAIRPVSAPVPAPPGMLLPPDVRAIHFCAQGPLRAS